MFDIGAYLRGNVSYIGQSHFFVQALSHARRAIFNVKAFLSFTLYNIVDLDIGLMLSLSFNTRMLVPSHKYWLKCLLEELSRTILNTNAVKHQHLNILQNMKNNAEKYVRNVQVSRQFLLQDMLSTFANMNFSILCLTKFYAMHTSQSCLKYLL